MSGRRETVMQALFAVLQGAYPWLTTSRRLKLWEEVPLAARPAMYLFEGAADQFTWKTQQVNPVITLAAEIIVYTNAKDPAIIPAALLNDIFDAISVALMPDQDEIHGRQTLGGLVNTCRIEGPVRRVPGDLDGDGMLWVPVRISWPQ